MHKKNLYPATPDFQLKRKKRERRKKKEVGLVGGLGSLTLPDLVVGSRCLAVGTRWPWVSRTHGLSFSFCFSGRGSQTHGLFCFFFVFPAMGLAAPRRCRPLPSLCPDTSRRPASQQVDDRSPRPTTGSRRPWVWF
jgi:hypothetical protein